MPQHDLVIDNASGAAFRADLNNALAALGSSMKGPNAPSAPTAGMVWVDDDTPSATVWTVKQYDGAEWIELGRLDVTNNVYIPSEGVIAWADVASAATVDLGAQASRSLRITGTTGITSFGTAASGVRKRLRIATGLTITHNATSLFCPGAANLVLGAGDILDVESLGSGNWVVAAVQRALSFGINLGTSIASTSGSSIDFTGIPTGVRRVTAMFSGLSTNGTLNPGIRLGTSGGVATTGYDGAQTLIDTTTIAGTAALSVFGGFTLGGALAANLRHGKAEFVRLTGNMWVGTLISALSSSGTIAHAAGSITLAGELDRLRFTTGGADTFDAGTINVSWEF